MATFVLLLTLTALPVRLIVSAQTNSSKASLYTEFFGETGSYGQRYRHITPLSKDGKRPLWLAVEVKKVIDLSDNKRQLTLNVIYAVVWFDYRLRWNPDRYAETRALHVAASNLWLPTIFVSNNARMNGGRLGMDEDPSHQLISVSYNGKCTWHIETLSVTTCDVDVRKFPFDQQTCELQLETRRPHVHMMHNKSLAKAAKIDDGEWILHGCKFISQALHLVDQVSGQDQEYFVSDDDKGNDCSSIIIKLHLQRRSFYYIVNFFVPCFSFSLINLSTFVIKPGSGERVGVSINVLLGIIIYQMIINDKLPETSESISALSLYIELIMVIATFSTMKFMIVAFLHRKEPRLPGAVRRFLCVHLVRLTCVRKKFRDGAFEDRKTYCMKANDDTCIVNMESCSSNHHQNDVSQDSDVVPAAPEGVTRLAINFTPLTSGDEMLRDVLLVLRKIETNTGGQRVVSNSYGQDQFDAKPSAEWLLAVRAVDRIGFFICLMFFIANNFYFMLNWLLSLSE